MTYYWLLDMETYWDIYWCGKKTSFGINWKKLKNTGIKL